MGSPLQKWLLTVLEGCWRLGLLGVSYVSVDWNPYSSIGFAGNAAIQFFNPIQQQHNEKGLLTCSCAQGLINAGQLLFFLPQSCVNKLKLCRTVSPLS